MSSSILVKKRINNIIVKKVEIEEEEDTRPVLGAELYPKLSANIFFVAKKGSGKTSGIFETVKRCANKQTKILAFVGSLYNDKSWIAIQKMCEEKDIEFEGYTSIFDEDGDNILEAFLNRLKQLKAGVEEDEGEEVEGEEKKNSSSSSFHMGEVKFVNIKGESKPKPKLKKRKGKYQSPTYMVILDDVSMEMKNKCITGLLKLHRHWPSKIILSSQSIMDLELSARNQIDHCILYGGMPQEKVGYVWKNMAIQVSFEQMWRMYREATEKKFDFLYIDVPENKWRMNFNTELEIPPEEEKIKEIKRR